MKLKLIMLASLLLVVSAYTCVAQVGPSKPNGPVGGKDVPNKPPPTASKLPDLVVMTTKGGNLDNGEVTVMVKNQGKGLSARSDVELSVSYASQPPVSIVHSVVPMQPGSTETITFDLKQSIVQAAFCTTVDSLKKVTESNEKNNRRCGKFGGKP
jgi:subtilase family serine protease